MKDFIKSHDEAFALISWYILTYMPVTLTLETNWRFLALVFFAPMMFFVGIYRKAKLYLVFMFLGCIFSIVYSFYTDGLITTLLFIVPSFLYWILSEHGYKEMLESEKER